MFAFVFKDWEDKFDIYQSPYIGDIRTKATKHIGPFIIYIAM